MKTNQVLLVALAVSCSTLVGCQSGESYDGFGASYENAIWDARAYDNRFPAREPRLLIEEGNPLPPDSEDVPLQTPNPSSPSVYESAWLPGYIEPAESVLSQRIQDSFLTQ